MHAKNAGYGYRLCGAGMLLLLALLFGLQNRPASPVEAQANRPPNPPGIQGPFVAPPVTPAEYNGSLLDREQQAADARAESAGPQPLKYTPNTFPKGAAPVLEHWTDALVQDSFGGQLMPGLQQAFAGISLSGGGSGHPPDPNGDVGPAHYIQVVNTSLAIFDKASGNLVTQQTFNTFFEGTNTPCDYRNGGDPVVVYDRFAGRWLISDFSIAGPYYECIAISKTSDPVNGGWYFYGVPISQDLMNDYPKVGVWRDGYYFSFNMFADPNSQDAVWAGVQVWAFEKNRLLNGQAIQAVSFALPADSGYETLLPGHALSEPPAGTPALYASVTPPNRLFVWKFAPNWSTPALSNFSGPQAIDVAEFASADSVEQPGTTTLLDSLSPRPMMQLIYRAVDGIDALWLAHSVTHRGNAAMRWYELRHPAGTAALYQQGTYQPDSHNRWMGALAVDADGNMAMGYSISSASLYPGIRYTGRLAGETLGRLPQGENVLVNGGGAQLTSKRWGDYSSMSVDPQDDCTFWYTGEYYATSGTNWQTRIAAFQFPSCRQPKGSLQGVVRNALTHQPVANVPLVAASSEQQMTVTSDISGTYTITLGAGTYQVTAGPLAPGYPSAVITSSVVLTADQVTQLDILLAPAPSLTEAGQAVNDQFPDGNQNGFPEPGENNLQLVNTLRNNGAITATHITARLESLTPGLVISQSLAAYPNIPAGGIAANLAPFTFSVSKAITCGLDLDFRQTITDSYQTYTETFSLPAAIQLERLERYQNDVEAGAAGWTTAGINNTWGITNTTAHSPVSSWADSPSGSYLNNSDARLISPVLDLSNFRETQVRFWTRYALEAGYDYVYLEYSTDGGTNWVTEGNALAILNGQQSEWKEYVIDAPVLDQQAAVQLRFRLVSDAGVTGDGIYLDDFAISYIPYVCAFRQRTNLRFPVIYK